VLNGQLSGDDRCQCDMPRSFLFIQLGHAQVTAAADAVVAAVAAAAAAVALVL